MLVALRDLRRLTPSERRVYLRRRFGWRAGSRRALPVGARADSAIVFVCFGNILRSPMAAALYREELGARGIDASRVTSAGVAAAVPPREAHPDGVAVARRLGVSLEAHRGTLLIAELVGRADLIVAMDHLHESMLLDRFPDAEGRVVLLGAFDPRARELGVEIEDPYGAGEVAVEESYRRIARSVEALLARLLGGQPDGG